MDKSLIAFLIAVIAVGVLLFVAISISKKRGPSFNKEDYQVDFLRIENALQKESEASYAMAIINGDKLLDKALTEMGIPGKTMGDRLKRCDGKFENLNAVWRVHKLRNTLAHEAGFEISYKQAFNALGIYKQAMKDLGAI